MRDQGSPLYLIVHWPDGSIGKIGTWTAPSELNDNFDQQKDIGWHAMFAMKHGAERVELVCGEITP